MLQSYCELCHVGSVNINVGGPVWSLAWCPLSHALTSSQYLAVYTHQHAADCHAFEQPSRDPAVLQVYDCGSLSSRHVDDMLECLTCADLLIDCLSYWPRVCSGAVRIGPLRFLTRGSKSHIKSGCRLFC